ncbi:hypothetical protein [Nocardioides sp.]|uniref:hypothetical protein n=1 Tax=Nocardioides sp. TaxID=35761 RepID=UPI003517F76A
MTRSTTCTAGDRRMTRLAVLPFLATLVWAGTGWWLLRPAAEVVLVPALAVGTVTGPLAVLALLSQRARPCRAFAVAGALALLVAGPALWSAAAGQGLLAWLGPVVCLVPLTAVVAAIGHDTPQAPPASHQSH